MDAREQGALLTARSTLVRRLKDVENSVRGLLRGIGSGPCCAADGAPRSEKPSLATRPCPDILEPLLVARSALRDQVAIIDKRVRDAVRQDQVCRRLMTTPGVGPIVALTYRAAVDQPGRFVSSKSGRRLFRANPAPISIRGNRPCRRYQSRGRRFSAGRSV